MRKVLCIHPSAGHLVILDEEGRHGWLVKRSRAAIPKIPARHLPLQDRVARLKMKSANMANNNMTGSSCVVEKLPCGF